MADLSGIDTLLFDLDGTLYGIENGYEEHVRRNVFAFMHEKLGVEKDRCEPVWREAFAKHNQTLKGLRSVGFEFDKEEYWDYIRSGREQFLSLAPQVASMLKALPHKKWVVTNCNEKHARLALRDMGLEGFFAGIIGADFMEPNAKPQRAAFEAVLAHIGAEPHACMMFEDSVKNLRTCKEMGMQTVLVAGETAKEEGAEVQRLVDEGVANFVIADCTEKEVRQQIGELFTLQPAPTLS
mmetsp:Transcript_27624/g.78161  ORF Transcript_27624/g.78161 Transcript_27624/m.78161 type:complete len:239 (-) Transcript_27624:388-1104(-)